MFDYWRESHFYGLSISIISHLQTNGQRIYVYIYIYIQWYVHCLITHNYKCIQYIGYISHSPLKLGLPEKSHGKNHHFAYETGLLAGGIPHNWIRSEWFSSHLPRGLHFGFLFFRRCHFLFPHVLWLCALPEILTDGHLLLRSYAKKKMILPIFRRKVMHHILSWIVDRLRRSANSPEKRGTPHGSAEKHALWVPIWITLFYWLIKPIVDWKLWPFLCISCIIVIGWSTRFWYHMYIYIWMDR